jgi:hypothetical protein
MANDWQGTSVPRRAITIGLQLITIFARSLVHMTARRLAIEGARDRIRRGLAAMVTERKTSKFNDGNCV